MPERIPQSAALRVAFVAYLSTDHLSPATGKTIPITISKNGGAFGNPSGGATNATEIAAGWYYADLSITDTGTVGPLIIYGSLAGIDTVQTIYDVAAYQAFPTNFSSLSIDASGRIDLGNWRGVQPLALNNNEVQVAPDWNNILNATATQALTNTTVKNLTGTPPDSAGVTTLLLRIASALSISAGAVTVGTVASGAITAASFAANALDAVWSTAARTLTAFSFTVNASLTQILGTALTETTPGWLTAAFRKFFNVGSPAMDMTNVNQTGDAFARLGAPAGASVSADIAEVEAETDGIAAIPTNPLLTSDTRLPASAAAGTSGGLPLLDANLSVNANVIDTGTAQGGSLTGITLKAGSSAVDDFYKGQGIRLVTGPGAEQFGSITAYNGTTKLASVVFVTAPTSATTYELLAAGGGSSGGGGGGITTEFAGAAAVQIDFIEAQSAKIGNVIISQNAPDLAMANQGIVAGMSYKEAYGNQITFTIANLLIASNVSVVYDVQVGGGAPTIFTAVLTTVEAGNIVGYFEIDGETTEDWGPSTGQGYAGQVKVLNTAVSPNDEVNVTLRPLPVAASV